MIHFENFIYQTPQSSSTVSGPSSSSPYYNMPSCIMRYYSRPIRKYTFHKCFKRFITAYILLLFNFHRAYWSEHSVRGKSAINSTIGNQVNQVCQHFIEQKLMQVKESKEKGTNISIDNIFTYKYYMEFVQWLHVYHATSDLVDHVILV